MDSVCKRQLPSTHAAVAWSVNLFRNVTCVLCYLSCLAVSPSAQTASATLRGLISDESGAPVAGVQVTISSPAGLIERHGVTDRSGQFVSSFLPPGHYRVMARCDGFAVAVVDDVILSVNDQAMIRIQLQIKPSTESVTVVADTSRSNVALGVGTVVDRQFIAAMPLNGRSLQALLQLVPGVVLSANTGVGATGAMQFNVNGQRATSNYFTVDGVSANTGIGVAGVGNPGAAGSGQAPGTTALGGTNSLASLDAVQEFRIETSTFAPEFGRTPGGQVSLVTRSGANQFHGSMSEYFRHDALDANNWFINARNERKPRERQHLFGAVLGGPLLRNRLFFFGSYEGLRLDQPTAIVVSVPTSEVRAAAPAALQRYLQALPLPNGRSVSSGVSEFAAAYSTTGSFDVTSLRLDLKPAESLSTFARLSHSPSSTRTRAFALTTLSTVEADNDAVTGGATWPITTSLTADVRVNWTRNAPRLSYSLDTYGGAVVPLASDIFRPGWDPSQANVLFTAAGSSFIWGPGSQDVQRQFNAVASVAWFRGSHQVKTGADFRRLYPLLGVAGGAGSFERIRFSGIQDVLNGRANSYQIAVTDHDPREAEFTNVSLFAQDVWRLAQRLTVTYGIRFERVPPPTEADGRSPTTVVGIDGPILDNPHLAPPGTPLWRSRSGDYAPRVGVAYEARTQAGRELTLRAGVGLFYDLGLGNVANAFESVYPFYASRSVGNVTFPLSDAVRTPPQLGLAAPEQLVLMDPALRLPYTAQWSVSAEQSLGRNQQLSVSYVGARGSRLLVFQTYLQPLAEWPGAPTSLAIQRNLGRSTYSALQTQYRRSLSQGLQALASYTLAASSDNASLADVVTPAQGVADGLAREFGPSDFDVRHQASAALMCDIPTFQRGAILSALSRHWGLDVLVRAQSAPPVSISAGVVFSGGAYYVPRPNLVAGEPLYVYDASLPGGRRLNADAFEQPPQNQQGNLPRNAVRGLGAWQVDLALRREVVLTQSWRLQLRAELFNVLNHPNFAQPTSSLGDPLFGRSTQMLNTSLGGLNALYQMGGPRSAQLALKILF